MASINSGIDEEFEIVEPAADAEAFDVVDPAPSDPIQPETQPPGPPAAPRGDLADFVRHCLRARTDQPEPATATS